MVNHVASGSHRQRVGLLIETHVIKRFGLFANKRQRTAGYYDAYDSDLLYEIKASSITNNRFILKVDNHKKLFDHGGEYLFISYDIKNKDHELKVISDITIKEVYQVSAVDIDDTLKTESKKFVYNKGIENRLNKNMYRVTLRHILSCDAIKNRT